jgi:hypothetical protein
VHRRRHGSRCCPRWRCSCAAAAAARSSVTSCSTKFLDNECHSTLVCSLPNNLCQTRDGIAVRACVYFCNGAYLPQHCCPAAWRQRKADHPAQASDCEHSVLQSRKLHSRATSGLRTARRGIAVQHDGSIMQSRVRTAVQCMTNGWANDLLLRGDSPAVAASGTMRLARCAARPPGGLLWQGVLLRVRDAVPCRRRRCCC